MDIGESKTIGHVDTEASVVRELQALRILRDTVAKFCASNVTDIDFGDMLIKLNLDLAQAESFKLREKRRPYDNT